MRPDMGIFRIEGTGGEDEKNGMDRWTGWSKYTLPERGNAALPRGKG
jgi:hypothetical protein